MLISTFWLWNFLNVRHDELIDENSLSAQANTAYDSLFYTQGSPSYWHTLSELSVDSVDSFGLLSSYYIDEQKIQKFNDSNASHYPTYSRILGLYGDVEGWDVQYFDFDTSGYFATPTYVIGISPSQDAQNIIRKEYYGVNQDNQPIYIMLRVWQ